MAGLYSIKNLHKNETGRKEEKDPPGQLSGSGLLRVLSFIHRTVSYVSRACHTSPKKAKDAKQGGVLECERQLQTMAEYFKNTARSLGAKIQAKHSRTIGLLRSKQRLSRNCRGGRSRGRRTREEGTAIWFNSCLRDTRSIVSLCIFTSINRRSHRSISPTQCPIAI
jgi:hypothetical protein